MAAFLGAGCAVPPAEPSAARGTAAVSTSDVRRLNAWQDAEFVAGQGEGRSAATGRGASMAPIFGDNTMMVLTRIPFEELESGMMVAYLNQQGFRVVHRLVERSSRDEWRVQGINNPGLDRERVSRHNYLGVVYASLVHEGAAPEEPAQAK